jgi:predicted GIY-YIG superfamily endonuclease
MAPKAVAARRSCISNSPWNSRRNSSVSSPYLPDKPGVYQMKDKDDKIIYIGKAKNLKKRVSQYFLRPQSGKVFAMVSHVDHFDFIIVHTDQEAFILEMNLIQTYYPRYNIMMMDDSHYPYIAVKRDDAFSRSPGGPTINATSISARSPTPRMPTRPSTSSIRSIRRGNAAISPQSLPLLSFGPMLGTLHQPDRERCLRASLRGHQILFGWQHRRSGSDLKAKMIKASEEERYEDAESYKEMIEAVKRTDREASGGAQ